MEDAFHILAPYLHHRDFLVRGEIALSLAAINGPKAQPIIKRRLRIEQDSAAKIRLLAALYLSGRSSALTQLIPFLCDQDDGVRCSVPNILGGVLRKGDVRKVIPAIKAALKREKLPGARGTLTTLLRKLSK
jgi:hypothetical protein